MEAPEAEAPRSSADSASPVERRGHEDRSAEGADGGEVWGGDAPPHQGKGLGRGCDWSSSLQTLVANLGRPSANKLYVRL